MIAKFKMPPRWWALAGLLLLAPGLVTLADAQTEKSTAKPDLTGTVRGLANQPLTNATVSIYAAWPKEDGGVAILSCDDCRKRATTDANGRFTIQSLDTDALFQVLIVAKDFVPEFVWQVDPAAKALDVSLKPVLTLNRTVMTPPPAGEPLPTGPGSRDYLGLEDDLDNWPVHIGKEGRFHFSGVPAETVSIWIMVRYPYQVSPRNASGDTAGFRLLGRVATNKTDLVIQLEPVARREKSVPLDYQALSQEPLRGAEPAQNTSDAK